MHAEQRSEAELKTCDVVVSQALLNPRVKTFSHNIHRSFYYWTQNFKIVNSFLVFFALVISEVLSKLTESLGVHQIREWVVKYIFVI